MSKASGAADTGVVEGAVEASKIRDSRGDQSVDLRLIRNVGLDENGVSAGFADHLERLVAADVGHVGKDDTGALTREDAGGGATDTGAAAGDKSDLAVEHSHIFP